MVRRRQQREQPAPWFLARPSRRGNARRRAAAAGALWRWTAPAGRLSQTVRREGRRGLPQNLRLRPRRNPPSLAFPSRGKRGRDRVAGARRDPSLRLGAQARRHGRGQDGTARPGAGLKTRGERHYLTQGVYYSHSAASQLNLTLREFLAAHEKFTTNVPARHAAYSGWMAKE